VSEADSYKLQVARSFARASATYDGVAILQRRVGGELMRWAPDLDAGSVILDLGAGTGFFSSRLLDRYPRSNVFALDIAEPMLRQCVPCHGLHRVLGDAENLPFASGTVDLIFSNMCIQWCRSPDRLFSELKRILKPQGEVIFSTFGTETLKELREAWAISDRYDHVIDFLPLSVLEACVDSAGFIWSDRLARIERNAYPDVLALMRELKLLGARHAGSNRSRTMTGRRKFEAMVEAYPRSSGEQIQASYELLGGRLKLLQRDHD
jgi:malonyl-CoA O-methyltransferase